MKLLIISPFTSAILTHRRENRKWRGKSLANEVTSGYSERMYII